LTTTPASTGVDDTDPTWQLQTTLDLSRKEAMASSAMTTTCDNFINAFAIYLKATSLQMGWLTAIPQVIGAIMQLLSVLVGAWLPRKEIILFGARMQTVLLVLMATLATWHTGPVVSMLIMLVICYHAMTNLIQPQWRAWMGSIVPQQQRGVYFASRTRITMAVSLLIFVSGGVLLSKSAEYDKTWMGFVMLFLIAFTGRLISCRLLKAMHDPDSNTPVVQTDAFFNTLREITHSMHDKTFRSYTLFVAGMQGAVAVSAPFFAVYMLNDLEFSYLQYSLNSIASIATQFMTLSMWGRFSDKHGNRIMMLGCSIAIPIVPMLWMVMPNFYYLLAVQLISGLVWSGFNLSTANYLYDIRPHHVNFATYAAVQSGISAVMVFIGAITGGWLASVAPDIQTSLNLPLYSPLFLVFLFSGLLRAGVLIWFIPHAEEPDIRTRPQLLKLIFRIARFNAVSGVVLDWLTVTEKPLSSIQENDESGRRADNVEENG
jgi:MFS family permease